MGVFYWEGRRKKEEGTVQDAQTLFIGCAGPRTETLPIADWTIFCVSYEVRRKREEKWTGLTLHSFYFYTICSSKVRGPAHPTNNLRTYETGTWWGRAQTLTHDLNQSGALTSWESRLTTKLKPARRTYKNCVLFVGKLSNFLGNSSN